MNNCLACGGTKKLLTGEPCPTCAKEALLELPILIEVPLQYQGLIFDKEFIPKSINKEYGEFLDTLLNEILAAPLTFSKNILIGCRPNSGKTVWAYNVYSRLYTMGITLPKIRDILEVKSIFDSYNKIEEVEIYSAAPLCIIKIPQDLPNKCLESISMIIDRRVRNNGSTIFLYNGTLDDLEAQDRFNKLQYLRGTGSFNTIRIRTFK